VLNDDGSVDIEARKSLVIRTTERRAPLKMPLKDDVYRR